MTKKFSLLLLDADIVISLFKLGIWDQVIERCDIHLAKTVEKEAHFYEDERGQRHDFSLEEYSRQGRITVYDMSISELKAFLDLFDTTYLDKLDPGETESLVFLISNSPECKLASADKIVYRILGNIDRSDQGISLEEILEQIGLGCELPYPLSRKYREKWTAKGFAEKMQGIGKK